MMDQSDIAKAIKMQNDDIDTLKDANKDLRSQLLELQQKQIRNPRSEGFGEGGGNDELAELLTKSDGMKAFLGGATPMFEVKVPARLLLKTQIINATGQNQPLVPADRRPGIIFAPQQRLLVQGLFQHIPTTSNLIEFASELSYTNAATGQGGPTSPQGNGEGESFAESAQTYQLSTSPVISYGHWIPASRQVLSDSAALQPHLTNRLLYGLSLKIENDILTGTGSANSVNGLTNQAAAFTGGSTNIGRIDVIATAINQMITANYTPDSIVLHPSDWLAIRLLKDTNGRFLVGDPAVAQPAALWGLPIVETPSMTQGNFLVLDSVRWGQIFDREDASVRVAEQHSDFFVRGMVAILATARLAFVTELASAGVYGSLTYAG